MRDDKPRWRVKFEPHKGDQTRCLLYRADHLNAPFAVVAELGRMAPAVLTQVHHDPTAHEAKRRAFWVDVRHNLLLQELPAAVNTEVLGLVQAHVAAAEVTPQPPTEAPLARARRVYLDRKMRPTSR